MVKKRFFPKLKFRIYSKNKNMIQKWKKNNFVRKWLGGSKIIPKKFLSDSDTVLGSKFNFCDLRWVEIDVKLPKYQQNSQYSCESEDFLDIVGGRARVHKNQKNPKSAKMS